MREILFRGKRTDNGEWVYGWLGHLHCYNPQEKSISSIYFTEITEDFNTKSNIIVDYKTVGQYTGFDDVYGVRIFEGDILYDSDLVWVIKYENGAFVAQDLQGKTYFSLYEHKGYDEENKKECFYITEYRKIGNIHDNPKLLEVEK